MKTARWYEIVGEVAHVYDAPYRNKACSVSIVPVSDLTYYRRTFVLSKIWGDVCPFTVTTHRSN